MEGSTFDVEVEDTVTSDQLELIVETRHHTDLEEKVKHRHLFERLEVAHIRVTW